MPARPPATLPSFDHLPVRWSPSDARAVLAALDASGLRPFEFARRTGLDPRRIWRARRGVGASGPSAQAGGGVRLVELVPRAHTSAEPQASLVRPALGGMAPHTDVIVPSPGAAGVAVAPTVATLPGVVSAADRPIVLSSVVEVTTPTGGQLRVPGELLAGLVQALSARPC